MSGRLRIDLDALSASATDLAKIANEFDDADTAVDLVTDAIGTASQTGKLRHAVQDFAGTWRIRRQEVKENVRYLSQTAAAVAEHLASTDQDLATNLTAPPPAAASVPRSLAAPEAV